MISLTPEARVISGFAFVVSLLLGGWRDLTLLMGKLVLPLVPGDAVQVSTVVVGLGVVGTVVGALLLARSGAAATETAWVRHLGDATGVLAVLIAGGALVGTVAAGLNNSGFGAYG
jgi:hypothetical protein